MTRLTENFFQQDALDCAPLLLGKKLVRYFDQNTVIHGLITEIEVYRGEEDLGCHASKGRTKRTEMLYAAGGKIYVYLIYGMYWLLNITTGPVDHPQAILIRGLSTINGPGRIGKQLALDKSFYGESIACSKRVWIEDQQNVSSENILCTPRIGIDYAKGWVHKPWRFLHIDS